MAFDRIMDAVARGEVAAGLIIHESRFTYPLYKLEKLLDLGEWWEKQTGLPIPLGGILGKRSLGKDVLLKIEAGIGESIRYAQVHTGEVLAYCGQHSQEMDETVMKKHIGLYVNDFSLDLGKEGLAAVRRLFDEAEAKGILPRSGKTLLAEEQ
jgi:1,4-dihydroxy-6-naphthoate synthase